MYSIYGIRNPLSYNKFFFISRNYSGRTWNWFIYEEMLEMGLSSVCHSVILTRFRRVYIRMQLGLGLGLTSDIGPQTISHSQTLLAFT